MEGLAKRFLISATFTTFTLTGPPGDKDTQS